MRAHPDLAAVNFEVESDLIGLVWDLQCILCKVENLKATQLRKFLTLKDLVELLGAPSARRRSQIWENRTSRCQK